MCENFSADDLLYLVSHQTDFDVCPRQ